MDAETRTSAAITVDLRALGLRAGDLVMVHASLRRIGPVEGRADGVIAAILEAIAPRGTMLMVLGAEDDHAWVNERPEQERSMLLVDAEPFDALHTPASSDVGTLAEVFRCYPGTVVSDHPEGRFAAHGPLAHDLLDDVPWDDYFGPGSPLERLTHGGRILRLDAGLDTVTALHHAEYRCDVDPKRRVRRYRLVASSGGPLVRTVDCLDDDGGIVDYPGEDYFADLMRDYLAQERAGVGRVGTASSELLDAGDIVAYGARWMDEHLAPLAWSVDPRALTSLIDADVLDARKRRAATEVRALRSLKGALANAEAVPVEERLWGLVEGSADVPRAELSRTDIDRIIGSEAAERRQAIEHYGRLGQPTDELEIELATIERYRRRRDI